MAYNYNQAQQYAPQNNQFGNQPQQVTQTNNFQQNIQPLFPQPQGNVYNINSTLEVANVPVGARISVALCMNEGIMYLKTMQNGNPLFWAYKITPFDNSTPKEEVEQNSKKEEINLEEKIKTFEEKFQKIEEQIEQFKKTRKRVRRNVRHELYIYFC